MVVVVVRLVASSDEYPTSRQVGLCVLVDFTRHAQKTTYALKSGVYGTCDFLASKIVHRQQMRIYASPLQLNFRKHTKSYVLTFNRIMCDLKNIKISFFASPKKIVELLRAVFLRRAVSRDLKAQQKQKNKHSVLCLSSKDTHAPYSSDSDADSDDKSDE